MSDVTGTIIKALIGMTALGSVFVYVHERQKIPKLSFDGYFKTEMTFLTGHDRSILTTYCVKIIDINSKSEGKIKSCVALLTVGSEIYPTTWMFVNAREHTFVNEAWLKLFDIDSRDQTVGFFSNGKRSPSSMGRRMGDSVTIRLKAARAHTPEPITEKVENIIHKAQYFF